LIAFNYTINSDEAARTCKRIFGSHSGLAILSDFFIMSTVLQKMQAFDRAWVGIRRSFKRESFRWSSELDEVNSSFLDPIQTYDYASANCAFVSFQNFKLLKIC
jgi:hypothetical protein